MKARVVLVTTALLMACGEGGDDGGGMGIPDSGFATAGEDSGEVPADATGDDGAMDGTGGGGGGGGGDAGDGVDETGAAADGGGDDGDASGSDGGAGADDGADDGDSGPVQTNFVPPCDEGDPTCNQGPWLCEPTVVPLVAGQSIDAGEVWVAITDDGVQIDVLTDEPWTLTQVHVYAGLDAPGPNPGSYPWSADLPGVDHYLLTIPLDELGAACGDTIYVAVHAQVVRPVLWGSFEVHSAWAQGDMGFDVGWGSAFEVTICCA